MQQTELSDELDRAEGLFLQGQFEQAAELLARLAADAEEYVNQNYQTTEKLQWFSFPTIFDRLAYRRVEEDPRELRNVGEPLDRLYSDLGFAQVQIGEYEAATEALKMAVRWNPMDCAHRLNLADLFRTAGNIQEYLGLTYSVFERAADAEHLVRAFINFYGWFAQSGRPQVAAAALRAARRFGIESSNLSAICEQAAGTDTDPNALTDAEAHDLLEAEGLPDGANAEIAVCLLMCASDSAMVGSREEATVLTQRAFNLVGEPAAMALLELIRGTDGEEASEDDSAPTTPAVED